MTQQGRGLETSQASQSVAAGATVQILSTSACGSAWRLIEIYGEQPYPFEVYLTWGAGGAGSQAAKVTLCRGGRIGLYARSLVITVRNLGLAANKVQVVVTDAGDCPQTRNVWEVRGEDGIGAAPIEIPPWAQRARLECASPTDLAASTVSVYDADSVLRSSMAGTEQPEEGIPLAGALSLTITNAGVYRVVFFLPF